MPIVPTLVAAVFLTLHLFGPAIAQPVDPGADRLPRFYADVCGTGGEGRGVAAWFAANSSTELAGTSDRALRYVLEGLERDGGWVLLTGHVDAAEAGEVGRLDWQRAEFVRNWLTVRGLRPERIWLRSRGAHEPIVVADGAALENRRVDFLLTQSGANCRDKLRLGINGWFRRNCFPTLRAADIADCDEALRLLQ